MGRRGSRTGVLLCGVLASSVAAVAPAAGGGTPAGAAAPAFTHLHLEHGWKPGLPSDGTGAPRVGKDGAGTVHLAGALRDGSTTAAAFVLPTADRPSHTLWLDVWGSGITPVPMVVNPNGKVFFGQTDFIDLAGISFPAATGRLSWQPLGLVNGWQSMNGSWGTGDPSAARDRAGVVHLAGALGGGTNAAFRLPKRMRPAHDDFIPVYTAQQSSGWLSISPEGWVTPEDTGGGQSQQFTSLAGVSFVAASTTMTPQVLSLFPAWQSGDPTYHTGDPTAFRDPWGVVHLDGSAIGTGGPGSILTFLGGSEQPAHLVYLLVYTFDGAVGELALHPDGETTPYGPEVANFTSLAGVSFPSHA